MNVKITNDSTNVHNGVKAGTHQRGQASGATAETMLQSTGDGEDAAASPEEYLL